MTMVDESALRSASLSGRVALVTGVSRRNGIGFAIAQRLAGCGANLFVQSLSAYDASQPWGADDVEALLADLRATGGRVEHLSADFSDSAAPKQIMTTAVAAYQHVDILIANHAYSTMGDLEALTAEQIDQHMAINVRGTLLLIQAFAAQHDGRPGGRVVMLTSGQHSGPMTGELAYVASKAALHGLTMSLSAHLVPHGITVNTINPGATDTGYADAALYQSIVEQSPQGRWGQPDDAARLITWLATDDAAWITGQVINSTGGGL
jgi:3-oxoacyl-[acyl-carrier protein] reductase